MLGEQWMCDPLRELMEVQWIRGQSQEAELDSHQETFSVPTFKDMATFVQWGFRIAMDQRMPCPPISPL